MTGMFYHILYFLVFLLGKLPSFILYGFSDVLFVIVYYLIRYRRRIVRKNLRNSFPEMSDKEIISTEKKFYAFFCDLIVESLCLLTITKEEARKKNVFEGCDDLKKSLEDHDYVIIYLGHYGNWEYNATLPWWFDGSIKFAQIYSPLRNKVFDRLFYAIRTRYGGFNIKKNETLRHMIGFRQRGEKVMVGFISDQTPRWINIHKWVDFLHQDTPVFTGTERIARKLNASVYYADMKRVSRGHYICHFRLMTETPQDLEEGELTAKYMKLLEENIQRDPAYWLWTHNRWKRQRNTKETEKTITP